MRLRQKKTRGVKSRIKAKLKKVAQEYNQPVSVGIFLLLDFIDDGALNFSLLGLLL